MGEGMESVSPDDIRGRLGVRLPEVRTRILEAGAASAGMAAGCEEGIGGGGEEAASGLAASGLVSPLRGLDGGEPSADGAQPISINSIQSIYTSLLQVQ